MPISTWKQYISLKNHTGKPNVLFYTKWLEKQLDSNPSKTSIHGTKIKKKKSPHLPQHK